MSNSVLDTMLIHGAQSDRGVVAEGGWPPTQPLCVTCIAPPIFSKCSLFVLISPAALTQNPLSVNV